MNKWRWQVIIFIIIGFLAGISGGLVVFNTILPNLTPNNGGATLVQRGSEPVSSSVLDVEQMGREMNQVVVEFYRPKTVGVSPSANIFLNSDLLGRGSVISTDGWVITHQSAFAGFDPRAVRVIHNGGLVNVLAVVKDRTTGLVMLKTSIKNVPSIKLGTFLNIHSGDAVAIGGAHGDWTVSSIVSKPHEITQILKDAIHTSEDLFRVGTLFGGLNKNAIGAPVVSWTNELVGVVAETKFGTSIIPVQYIMNSKDSIFQNQKIERPYLGVTYISLPKNTVTNDLNFNQNGALVVADQSLGAYGVAAKSPAANAGILPGDVILSVNDEEINQTTTLSELLLPYKKGDVVELKLLRKKEEKTVKVTLGSLLTSSTSFAKVSQSN